MRRFSSKSSSKTASGSLHVRRRRRDRDERQHDVALLDLVLDPLLVDRDVALEVREARVVEEGRDLVASRCPGPRRAQSVVLQDALGQRVADEAVDPEDENPHQRPLRSTKARRVLFRRALGLQPQQLDVAVVAAGDEEPRLLGAHLARETCRARRGRGRRERQTKVLPPKTSVKAPGYGCVTARTRSWTSFAVRVQSMRPSSGVRRPKRVAAASSCGAARFSGLPLFRSSIRRARTADGGGGDAPLHLDRRVVGPDRHRLLVQDRARGRRASVIAWSVAPVSVSPFNTAQLTGARPRNFGRSEPCMFQAPSGGSLEHLVGEQAPVVEGQDEVRPRPTARARSTGRRAGFP